MKRGREYNESVRIKILTENYDLLKIIMEVPQVVLKYLPGYGGLHTHPNGTEAGDLLKCSEFENNEVKYKNS